MVLTKNNWSLFFIYFHSAGGAPVCVVRVTSNCNSSSVCNHQEPVYWQLSSGLTVPQCTTLTVSIRYEGVQCSPLVTVLSSPVTYRKFNRESKARAPSVKEPLHLLQKVNRRQDICIKWEFSHLQGLLPSSSVRWVLSGGGEGVKIQDKSEGSTYSFKWWCSKMFLMVNNVHW